MTFLTPSVRLVTQLPSPLSLSDYEPFREVALGQFGVATLKDVSNTTIDSLKRELRRGFESGRSIGYSTVDRVKAVFFDMDSTVIAEESIVELARQHGVAEEVQEVTDRAMAGELDFETALRERVSRLHGLSEDAFVQVAARFTINPGMEAFAAFCREINVPFFLVSGGFVPLAKVLQKKLGFAAIFANELEVRDGVMTGEVQGKVVDAAAKAEWVAFACEKLKLKPEEVAAVGDGANDIPMLSLVGSAVGYDPKPILLGYVQAVNCSRDHRFLGPLLFGRDIGATRIRSSY